MLDSDTKRRINTCRDILVGKVPDPKSQVEQITIALIYKFMDDMDLESEEMGGTRSFFAGEYERYGWAKLVAPGVGGQEMLNTYTEALIKMVENPGIPELFRSIFRNAYLPYRDPETLRSFLREINGFTYDHSERLGDAFEYLLSVLGSQGDAGQFRTPRHIIDFMVEIIDPKKGEVILDPACGTAGFLISSYKHILKANSTDAGSNGTGVEVDAAEATLDSPLRYSGNLLTPDDRQRLASNIKGYDISPDMVRLSLVNLYLHGFADPRVEEYDTLTSDDKWGETADVILANPPFMSPKGGIKPHNRFGVPSKRSEVLFVDYIAEHLNPKGRAAIVVPEGIIFQSQSAYCELRRMLVDKYLAAVVSLPAGVFNPYSGVKTSILILDRAVAKASDSIAFFKIENDGFGLGAQRRAVKGSQLPQVKVELRAWLDAARGAGATALGSLLGFTIEKARIAEGGEYNLSVERYRETSERCSIWPFARVGEAFSKSAETVLPENLPGPVTYVGLENIASNLGTLTGETVIADPSEIKSLKNCFQPGDILYGKLRPNLNKVWLADREGICSTDIFVIRAKPESADARLYAHLFRHGHFNQMVLTGIKGAQLPRVGWQTFGEIEIPLPPLEVQREIVAEIEGYQKVIDGARAVLEKYRPHIPVDPAWPTKPLAEVARVNPKKSDVKDLPGETLVSFVPMAVLQENRDSFHPAEVKHLGDVVGSYTYFRDDDVLVAKVTPCFENGKAGIARGLEGGIGFGSSEFYVVRAGDQTIPRWLYHWLTTPDFRARASAKMTGTGGLQRVPRSVVEEEPIPLPSIEIQQFIIAEIEAEQALVEANRELIVRFEKKIEAAIARMWGGAGEAAEA
ncbi:N-6 DNA methylase [Sphingomonas sanguinis]|uniref:N-6 DNA methylase n=1 Tax=Sphingomonas sanguinis TaxID=33051 RepID=UPI001C561215|nr:N-6 DNA methylase [Sphingomonas sanguinis]QXT37002.1 N-6 DNA methylase [Sphingomonas sanguinis]